MSTASETKAKIVKKLKALWTDSRSYLNRALFLGAVMLAFSYTFIFFGPFEMVAFGGNSMNYTYKDIVWMLLGLAAAVTVVVTLLGALLRGKIFNYFTSSMFVITICGYLQANFLNGGLGALTGDAIDWILYRNKMLLGLAIWLGVLLVVFFIMYLWRPLWKKMVLFLSILLLVMQITPTFGIVLGFYERAQQDTAGYSLSDEGLAEYSKNGNIFVFVLDRLDYDYIEGVLKKDPDFFKKLDGFTMYENAISQFARTQPALSHIVTGQEQLAYKMAPKDYYQQIWTAAGEGNSLPELLSKEGYTTELYANPKYMFSEVEFPLENIKNYGNNNGRLQKKELLGKLMNLSAYRYTPIALKPYFFEDTNYYNDVFVETGYKQYVLDDVKNAKKLFEATADREEKSFKFFHFFGSHSPYRINEDGSRSEKKTNVTAQTMGSFNNLYRIFDQMKKLGIYKDATIIITGDHGAAVSDKTPMQKETRIGLFYKPSGSEGTELVMSKAQVMSDNIPATILKNAGADYSAYGKALDDIGEDETVERYYYKHIVDQNRKEVQVYKYSIDQDASNLDNWKVEEIMDIEQGFY